MRSLRSFPVRSRQSGFALIVTVVLVAFLVLILVGLATFTRVETQVADNTRDVAEARQNATSALNLAIGQLQRHAGIDRATTARGDLFGYSDKRKNIVTVWSYKTTGDSDWTQKAWLVSGSEPNKNHSNPSLADTLDDVEVPTGTEDNTTYTNVFLVGDKSVDSAADRILVKRQPIETAASNIPGLSGSAATKIGHYAYWVGDEGAKASLNIVDPTRLTAPLPNYNGGTMSDWTNAATRERLTQQMLPQPWFSGLHSDLSSVDLTNAAVLAQLAKIESSNALSFVAGNDTTVRELFHDVTPRAEAVLANPTSGDGRLKVDLSDTTKGSQAVRDYVAIPLSSSTDYTTTHDVTASSFPIITEASIRLSFYRDSGNIGLAYQLDVETWNPYASALRYNSDGNATKVGSETDHITIEVSGLPNVSLSTDGTTPTNVGSLALDANLDGPTFTDANLSSGSADLIWEPGQFKVIGTHGGDMLLETTSASPAAPRVTAWTQALAGSDDTMITVTYAQIVNTLEVRLKVNGVTVSTYKPTQTFSGSTTNTTATTATNFCLGYGIQLINDVGHFASSEDPRQSSLPASCFETGSTSTWGSDPSLNATVTFNSGDDFNFDAGTPKQIALFDLRRQEVVSVGQLRHLIGNTPYRSADGLYDDNFFSTTPAAPWTSDDIATKPLPNRYLRLINPVQLKPTVSAIDSDLRDGDLSARYLLQTAAFNINSTSIPAWKAVLGGARLSGWTHDKDGVTDINPGGNDGTNLVALNHAFFRFGHGGQFLSNAPLATGNITNQAEVMFTAGRELTATDITNLATAIVTRGKAWVNAQGHPYRSIQEFISSGVVTQAISDTTINAGLPANRAGTPGQLTQADVIAAIAPLITPRSDTFKIRAYGDVYNPITEKVTSRAWCEAIVQRVPDLAEDLTVAATVVNDPDFSTYTFGRKFIIVSFRWLSSDDI